MKYFLWLSSLQFLLLSERAKLFASAQSDVLVRINEVADKGTSADVCDGEDWIELYLPDTAPSSIDLIGYQLHDDSGPSDPDAFTFTTSTILQPNDYLLVCVDGPNAATSPQFKIGGNDQVTLREPSGAVVSTTGNFLQNLGDVGVTLAFNDANTDNGSGYVYTVTPTPGSANVITPLPEPETVEEMRARLIEQNEQGTAFFNMNSSGYPVEDGFPSVVDLRMVMDPAAQERISNDERGYEVYSPFLNATLTAFNDPETVLLNLPNAGRIRPKGQSTMYLGVCMNRTTPYVIDWDHSNKSQTLFGVERSYLRTHWGDPSFVREWATHRMLARFDLPHLRTRTVRLFINDDYYGLYSLMEAPDQDYVFQRSFPDFDRENYGLYKVKTLSLGCGLYDKKSLDRARARVNETGPYVYERGEHRPKPPVLGNELECFGPFIQSLIVNETADVTLAYVRSGEGKCGDFLIENGLIDRDMGTSTIDAKMSAFIDSHLADNVCDEKCSNSDLAKDVDVTNFLRNFASQAALLNTDSPLGNGNNYYLAHHGTGEEGGPNWAMVQYDHNGILSSTSAQLCDGGLGQCSGGLMKWSITRPTCRSLETSQMAGPLLTDDVLRERYIEYVREFVDEVMTDDGLLTQIKNHLEAMKDLVAVDPWNDYASVFESLELAQGDDWYHDLGDFGYTAFLPALRARGAEIQKQLAAIDSGTFPRTIDEYNPGEPCVDWETESPPDFACPNNCYHKGCSLTSFATQAFCDEESQTCFVGELDFDCIGVPDGVPLPGSNPEADASPSFCSNMMGFPIRATMCAPYEELIDDGNSDSGAGDKNVTTIFGSDDGSSSSSNGGYGSSTNGGDGDGSDTSSSSTWSILHLPLAAAVSMVILASTL